MRTIAVIPARFQSKRLPGKPLEDLHGKTMLQRVYERASLARRADEVLVATDDERIAETVRSFGGRVTMTSPTHPSGSDRVAEAVSDLTVDLVVNVQGDEPLLEPAAIDEAIEDAGSHRESIVTLRRELTERERLLDPNVVKVVANLDGFAMYFSRSAIPAPPADPDELPPGLYYEHIGLYAYPKAILMNLTRTSPSRLELAEGLEQLRALEHGVPIRVIDTSYRSISVDTASDLEKVRELLAASQKR
jgi:3-deoxy-manno-octulosonate cytidylyltransferase (CMP-KDO synthetase)